VREAGVLDLNSSYAYLLLADRFGDTSVVAEHEGRILGFVAGFLPPRQPDTVFVWQIGVSPEARGLGLGRRLLGRLVDLPGCRDVSFLETTITPSNEASERLFRSFARHNRADVDVRAGYTTPLFPDGKEQERLFRIGPLAADVTRRPSASN
jgi:diaminobutyrate acetyltransferase